MNERGDSFSRCRRRSRPKTMTLHFLVENLARFGFALAAGADQAGLVKSRTLPNRRIRDGNGSFRSVASIGDVEAVNSIADFFWESEEGENFADFGSGLLAIFGWAL